MLKENIVALITPFDSNGDIDYVMLKKLIAFHVFSSTDALVILGTTSEAATLTNKEKEDIVKFIIKENNHRLKIVVGVSENNTLIAKEKAVLYEELGADYLLVLTPYYNKCNEEGLYQHFKLISDNINIPIILYNVPSRTGVNISIDVLKRLKEIPNVLGIKEASQDIKHIIEVSLLCDEKFYLYGGNDELSYLFLSLNAKGLINVLGNFDPNILFTLIKTYEENSFLSYKYFKSIYPLLKALSIDINPIPIKELMNYYGYYVGNYRVPLCSMSEQNKKILLDEFNKISV